VPCEGDCDDDDPETWSGAPELCDGVDNDCDGAGADELVDEDGDGLSPCEGDCDDTDGNTWPGAEEICDGVANDCGAPLPADEQDDDGDGFMPCDGDCDDSEPAAHPGQEAELVCEDGVDNDCDGLVDMDDEDCIEPVTEPPPVEEEPDCSCDDAQPDVAAVGLVLFGLMGFAGKRPRRRRGSRRRR
jgi:hypothetical protein